MEIGEHEKSIELLQLIVDAEKQCSPQQHTALAIPLAKLSVAYYHNGDWERSAEAAEKSLNQELVLPWDGMTFCMEL